MVHASGTASWNEEHWIENGSVRTLPDWPERMVSMTSVTHRLCDTCGHRDARATALTEESIEHSSTFGSAGRNVSDR